MPCSDPSPSPEHREYNERVDANNREAARILCLIIRGPHGAPGARLREWDKEHRAIDAFREALEKTDEWFAYNMDLQRRSSGQ